MTRIARTLRRLARDDRGTTLVEFAIVIPVFLLMLMMLLDFGRLGYEYVLAQKAIQKAARIAAVRPAACAGVPDTNVLGTVPNGVPIPKYGTNCSAAGAYCVVPTTVTCTGVVTNATAQEIWTAVRPLLPPNATIAKLRFRYAYDPNFGFLGGPYVPMVTVGLDTAAPLHFTFISPLGGLASLLGLSVPSLQNGLSFPSMSVSLPGEDLNQGVTG